MNAKTLIFTLAACFAALQCSEKSKKKEQPKPDGGTKTGEGIEGIEASENIAASGLEKQVNIVRDKWGAPHIYASSRHDLAYALGFMHAKDRLFQMELFRRFPSGTLSELFGAAALAVDEGNRIFGMRRVAQQEYDALGADDPLRKRLEDYAEGVNGFLAAATGIDIGIELATLGFTPETITPWTPVDSMAFARYQTYDLSYTNYLNKLDVSLWFQSLLDAFPQGDPREGIAADLLPFRPVKNVSIIDGMPDKATSALRARREESAGALARYRWSLPRTRIEPGMLERARRRFECPPAFAGLLCGGGEGQPAGSNNWVVGGALTESGNSMLANDPHLGLSNPSIFYEVHLDLTRDGDEEYSVQGVSFAAGPAVILGHNGRLAWGATVISYDVTDYYVEEVDPQGGGRWGAVLHYPDGEEGAEPAEKVKIEARKEEFRFAADEGTNCGGSVPEAVKAAHTEWKTREEAGRCVLEIEYPIVPHHGPILSFSDNGRKALSVRWTGFDPSEELRSFMLLGEARNWEDFETAMDNFKVGAQNWVMIDEKGGAYYSGSARLPIRRTISREYPPWLPMPGTGDYDWTGEVADNLLPHALNPQKGFIATANNDPMGISFDGDPLNEVLNDGWPYVGFFWDPGFRAARITDRLTNATGERAEGAKITLDDIKAIQGDHHSGAGDLFTPVLGAAIEAAAAADNNEAGADASLKGMVSERMKQAWDAYLSKWSFEASSGMRNETSADEVRDSIATSIFNAWLTTFVPYSVGDELSRAGIEVSDDILISGINNLVHGGDGLVTQKGADGKSVIFDDLGTADRQETMNFAALKAFADCLASLEQKFGTAGMAEWKWGKLHTLTLEHASGDPVFGIPPPNDPEFPGKMPRHGDNWCVDASDYGLGSTAPAQDFTFGHGPSMRFAIEMTPDGPNAEIALPGGETGSLGSDHYSDQFMKLWSVNQYHKMWYTEKEVVENAETRIVLHP